MTKNFRFVAEAAATSIVAAAGPAVGDAGQAVAYTNADLDGLTFYRDNSFGGDCGFSAEASA